MKISVQENRVIKIGSDQKKKLVWSVIHLLSSHWSRKARDSQHAYEEVRVTQTSFNCSRVIEELPVFNHLFHLLYCHIMHFMQLTSETSYHLCQFFRVSSAICILHIQSNPVITTSVYATPLLLR